ncbi:MAG TPA: SprT-like domain-containing protein [Ferruginibacter sp.]|nr:SprT-like domain-containing protein [Ferruginibacter sp.]
MPKEKTSFDILKNYLPHGSFEGVMDYIVKYKVHLTISRQRQSILGDYRHAHAGKNHRISVNGNLNKYAFLITLLHELAHLFTYERYGHRVQAHGAEWKNAFAHLLAQFLQNNIFPTDITQALSKSLHNAAASSCADEQLMRVLKNYDLKKEGFFLVEQLPIHSLFVIKNGRVFERGETIRKRIKCKEIDTGKLYLFSPVYEVKLLEK